MVCGPLVAWVTMWRRWEYGGLVLVAAPVRNQEAGPYCKLRALRDTYLDSFNNFICLQVSLLILMLELCKYSTSESFPDCGNITIWCLPWFQVSFVSFRVVVPFGVHTLGPAPLPLLDASMELLFSHIFWHHFWLSLYLRDLVKVSCL